MIIAIFPEPKSPCGPGKTFAWEFSTYYQKDQNMTVGAFREDVWSRVGNQSPGHPGLLVLTVIVFLCIFAGSQSLWALGKVSSYDLSILAAALAIATVGLP